MVLISKLVQTYVWLSLYRRITYLPQAIQAGGGVLHEGSRLAVPVVDIGEDALEGLVYLGGFLDAALLA